MHPSRFSAFWPYQWGWLIENLSLVAYGHIPLLVYFIRRLCITFFFLCVCHNCEARAYAVALCLSVCPSVKLVYCVKMADPSPTSHCAIIAEGLSWF